MAIDFTWTWGPMTLQTVGELEDVVTGIQWKCVAKDVDTETEVFQTGQLPVPSADPNTFIQFKDLTKLIVDSWIETMDKTDTETVCTALMNSILNPPIKFADVPQN